MLIGSTLCIGAFYFASYAKTWYSFLIIYAGVFPIGVGLCYWTPIMCGWEHLPSRKGLVSGLIIGGFGFGAFIFGFISTAIANPANEHKIETKDDPDFGFFHHSVSDKVPSTLR
jgi:MFS family permease